MPRLLVSRLIGDMLELRFIARKGVLVKIKREHLILFGVRLKKKAKGSSGLSHHHFLCLIAYSL